MAIVQEILKINENNTLSFGNYTVKEKQKKADFIFDNDTYKCKTHNEITKLEKNGSLLLETVPGATVHNLDVKEDIVTFAIEGSGDTKITVELEENTNYNVTIDGENLGVEKSNISGKLSFSHGLLNTAIDIKIEKK